MVSAMSEDDGRSDDYWMGVRDALRMVDSFLKWSRKNRSRAKSLDDFVHDGLIAAAKRCESCLSEKLGLKFQEDDEESHDEAPPDDFEMTTKSLVESAVVALSDSSFEQPVADSQESVQEEPGPPEEGITVESVQRIADESMSEYDVEGPPRDFSSDFELVEPSPLLVEDDREEPERVDEIAADEEAPMSEDQKEPESTVSSFTWSEYEEAVSPSEEELPEQETEDADPSPDELQEVSNPYGEPSIPEEELTKEIEEESVPSESLLDSDEEEADDNGDAPITEPPPPPPPPESDEDEEERKRRARRLFFGA